MSTDIQQDDFRFSNDNGEGDSIAVGYADCLYALKIAAEKVVFQVRLKWVAFEIMKYGEKPCLQIRVLFNKFLGGTCKMGTPDKSIHTLVF